MPYADPQREREYQRQWMLNYRRTHPGYGREAKRRWDKANPKRVKLHQRRTYLRHREACLARQRAYYNSHKEVCLAKMKAYAKAHPEVNKRSQRAHRLRNLNTYAAKEARRRALISLCSVDSSADKEHDRIRSLKAVRCYYCGKKISGRIAHIDHIIALSRGGAHTASNLCASCPGCNLSKGPRFPSQIKGQPLLNI